MSYSPEYYKKNKDKFFNSNKKWVDKNAEKIKKYKKKHYDKNAEKYKNLEHTRQRQIRYTLLGMLGGVCKRCGFDDFRALQIDHIRGNGNSERHEKGVTSMYRHYIKNPNIAKDNLQVLCANCNWIKRNENNEWSKGRKASFVIK